MWAVAITVFIALTDGISPDEYDSPNSAALGFLFFALLVVLPIAALVVYVIARAVHVGRLGAVLIAQLPAVIAAVWLVSAW
jgi:hypothetical protein